MNDRKILKSIGDLALIEAAHPTARPMIGLHGGNTAMERRIARLWSDYGAAIESQANENGVPVGIALAVFAVESGRAYGSDGLVMIRFEPHIFRRCTGVRIPVRRKGQRSEWRNFERAYAVDPGAAFESTSWGLPQLMGFNYRVTGHDSARAVALAFQRSCVEQVAGFFGFVKANNLLDEIRDRNWRKFTRAYNGTGQVDHYSRALGKAIKCVESIKMFQD